MTIKERIQSKKHKRAQRKANDKKDARKPYTFSSIAFILPSFIGVCLFVLLPFADVLRRSVTNVTGRSFVGLDNYKTVFENSAFRQAVVNTRDFLIMAIPTVLLLSLIIALALSSRKMFGGKLLKTAFLVPMAIPVASVVLILRVLFYEKGYFSVLLMHFGLEAQDWMQTEYSLMILAGVYVWRNLGYNVVLWMAGIGGISTSITEAAEVDGASAIQRFFYITLPNLMPTLYTVTVLAFLNSFKVFREGYLIGGDYPHRRMYLVQHIFNNWFRELSLDRMAAGAVLVAGVILILIMILQRAWDKEV